MLATYPWAFRLVLGVLLPGKTAVVGAQASRDRVRVVAEILRRTRNRARSSDIAEFLDAALARGWITEA